MKNSKKIKLFMLLTLLSFSLTACSTDDEELENEPQEIEEIEEEDPVDKNDLLNTLEWSEDEISLNEFKQETVSGYDITIGTAFYDVLDEDSEEDENEESEETDNENPYNILQWMYAEYDDSSYLLLEYNYEDNNYKAVFYRDSYENVNVAELYIDLEKQEDRDSITEWCDSVFIIEDEEPEEEVEEESEEESEETSSDSTEIKEEQSNSLSTIDWTKTWYASDTTDDTRIELKITSQDDNGFNFTFDGADVSGYAEFNGNDSAYYVSEGGALVDFNYEVIGGAECIKVYSGRYGHLEDLYTLSSTIGG